MDIKKEIIKNWKLVETDILSKEIVTLPIYPDMKREQVYYIIDTIKKFVSTLNL